MTALNARTESFVTLILEVSGRVRPSDIQGVSPSEAAELLQAYVSGRPGQGLVFDGDAVVKVQAGAGETPSSWMFDGEVAPQPVVEDQPTPVVTSMLDEESDMFEGLSAVAAAPLSDAPISRDLVDLPPLEDAQDAIELESAKGAPSRVLVVALVVLVIVTAAAAAYFLGAFELLGLGAG